MIYVLDTNIITAVFKGNVKVKERLQEAIVEGEEVFINGISYYEMKRGFLARNATTQLRKFEQLCSTLGLVLLDTKDVFDQAAEIYAELQKKGELIEDADILIASSAKIHDFILVSDNTEHFNRIPGLKIENWLN